VETAIIGRAVALGENVFENLKSAVVEHRRKWHFRVFNFLHILVLSNNEDKYCYLQLNVTKKIVEIWSPQIVRNGIWQLSPCHNTSQRL
jgi:hypothetical protein